MRKEKEPSSYKQWCVESLLKIRYIMTLSRTWMLGQEEEHGKVIEDNNNNLSWLYSSSLVTPSASPWLVPMFLPYS